MALDKLGYAPSDREAVAFIDERNTIVGAPKIKSEHYPVFDCAIGDRAIHYMGHEDDGRRAAVHLRRDLEDGQPARGGDGRGRVAAPDRVVAARRQGDRDLPRQLVLAAQPLSGSGDKNAAIATTLAPVAPAPLPKRRRVPEIAPRSGASSRSATTRGTSTSASSRTAPWATSSSTSPRKAMTLAGLMNSFMISVSLGLQYMCRARGLRPSACWRFEPSGLTNDTDIRVAKSIVDYIFRWMGKKFLTSEQQEEAVILTAEVKARLAQAYANGEAAAPEHEAPPKARPRSSTPGRTRSSAPSAAAAWCARAVLHVSRLRHEHRLQLS